MAGVSQLGYLGIGASDLKSWNELAASVLGMQVIPGDDRSTSYLRMDDVHHRLAIRANGGDDIDFVGWEVPDMATLHRIAQQLEDGGVRVRAGTRSRADDRRVDDFIEFVDPNGVASEIFVGRPRQPETFHPTREMTGYATGAMGLGHFVVMTANLDESVAFYRDLLGFRVSDYINHQTPGGLFRMAFLRCNARHHSIAFMENPHAPRRIHHVMFECRSLADVGTGRDICLERGVPIAVDLGCHINDRTTSFYFANPSKFALELGWGGRMMDDAMPTEYYTSAVSIWGHPQIKELVSGGASHA